MTASLLPAPPRIVLGVLLPFALGYMLSYLLRAVNAVVGPVLATEFSLSAGEMGLLTAAYLGAFAIFQLPLGVMLDRYGPRRIQAALLLISALGSLGFALSTSFPLLFLARALIGIGFAAGLMSSFKAIVMWVAVERRPFANSCVMACGGLGILLASEPTQILLGVVGWREVFGIFAAVTAAVAVLIYLVVPEKPQAASGSSVSVQFGQMAEILRSGPFWRAVPLLGLTAGIHIAVLTLWSGPWLRDVLHLSKDEVSRRLLWIAVAFIIGMLTTGVIADRLGRRGIGSMQVLLGCQLLYFAAQAVIVFQWLPGAMAAWMIVSGVGQTATLGFPWLQRFYPASLAGRSNATLNFAMFVVAFCAQYGIGLIIDLFPRSAAGYDPLAYRWALGLCLILQAGAFLWYLLAPIGREAPQAHG